jgi:hypothetical protein
MTDTPTPVPKRNIWLRALLMLLMGIGFQLTATLLCVLAVLQFVLALLNAPNARLRDFGRNLGQYLRQIADFVCFAREDAPFPFSDWPTGH